MDPDVNQLKVPVIQEVSSDPDNRFVPLMPSLIIP
jgi:hypothetical protein